MNQSARQQLMYRTLRYGFLAYFVVPVATVVALANLGVLDALFNSLSFR